ncbi:MAG: hypothetical protein ACTSWR_07795 [Candidatus Helarchaeota archaeon]
MKHNKNYLLIIAICFGLIGYIIFYFKFLINFVDYLRITEYEYDKLFLWTVINLIILLIFQIPSILIYYNYKLKIVVVSEIDDLYQEGELIELEIQISDSSNFIFIDVNLEIKWPENKYKLSIFEKSFLITLETAGMIGIHNLIISASKKGYFRSVWKREFVIT